MTIFIHGVGVKELYVYYEWSGGNRNFVTNGERGRVLLGRWYKWRGCALCHESGSIVLEMFFGWVIYDWVCGT